ncbi:hypothetical protein CEXT_513101 [Caerostris extrusa]|uniref:Uncharacterized protein n=1 Tax=Caerostris extrusa TaxID=172846 RepID=A0AAV4PN23_CAEEX|nr:hypothetical protein CEXT_513101 [Caerostris extrusa]
MHCIGGGHSWRCIALLEDATLGNLLEEAALEDDTLGGALYSWKMPLLGCIILLEDITFGVAVYSWRCIVLLEDTALKDALDVLL